MNQNHCTEQKLKYPSKNRSLLAIKVTEFFLHCSAITHKLKELHLSVIFPFALESSQLERIRVPYFFLWLLGFIWSSPSPQSTITVIWQYYYKEKLFSFSFKSGCSSP